MKYRLPSGFKQFLERLRRGKITRDDLVAVVFVAVVIGVLAWIIFSDGPCEGMADEADRAECIEYHTES